MRIQRLLQVLSPPVGDSKGVALIMALWVITILSVVVLEFSFSMRTEANITRNYQEGLQLYAFAEGGEQRAIAELMLKLDTRFQQLRKAVKERDALGEYKEWVTDGREYRVPFDRGESTVRVIGEAGKVNINRVTEGMLRKIMTTMGMEQGARDTAVDSILDWRDPDDFIRINGAENDYYRSLKDPYDCKNGDFDSVEELMLVRGVTSELFYGKKGKQKENRETQEETFGLKDIFSVYGTGEQIDINSASFPVLKMVLGLPLEVCRNILTAREERGFENLPDLLLRVPDMAPYMGEIGRLVIFRADSPYYTIEAKGKSEGGNSTRGIRVIVKIDPKENEGYKIIQWLDTLL